MSSSARNLLGRPVECKSSSKLYYVKITVFPLTLLEMGLEILLISLLFLCPGLKVISATDDWGYWGEGAPENWKGLCATGKKQSPIDIVTENTVKTDMGALKFIRYDFAFSGKITNNGHSVKIQLDGVPIHLMGADLPSTYVLEQMHFHWGAEHTVDGVRDALELHFVHHDNQYENVSVAAQYENGIAVVATLFELSKEDNLDLMPIIKAAESVSKWVGKNTAAIRTKIIPYLFLPKDHTTYYRYDGSLTTPACQESVMWFVLTEKLPVSEQQLSVLQSIETKNGELKFNHRPTQPLNGREVYHHLDGYSKANSVSSNLLYTSLGVLLGRALHTD